MDFKEEIILCACHSPKHQIVVQHDTEDNMVYLNVRLSKLSFKERLKVLFGKQVDYEEVILESKHKKIIKGILKTIKNAE